MTASRFCQSCGALLTPGYRFCGACGQSIAANGGGMPPSPMAAPPRVRAALARSNLVVALLAFLLILVVGGEVIWWFLWQNSPTATETVATPSSPSPPARTGDITTGPTVTAASQTIASSGGIVAVSNPGDPLDGFVINVPANSYADSRAFTVSYAPITNQTFGSDITPISPMITVDNGGGYSEELMYIRVPVQVPDSYFAMGFLYDEQTKQLEGMPLVGSDANSITVATQHFSNFFISRIEETLLKNIDSGFKPGIDDWQFDNKGSYITPGGNCEGQSISAMWYYYTKPDGKEACLYDRYDNNGDQPATPNFWQDDSLSYRFCSTIQLDISPPAEDKWFALAGISLKFEDNTWKVVNTPSIGDASTRRLFAYSIKASGQPQLVITISNAGDAHAIICYAVSDNGTLRIADPNKHGEDDRIIEFVDNQFRPYNLAGKDYEKVVYAGAWTIVPYDKIAGRWTEFKNKTIGNDRFPDYNFNLVQKNGGTVALTDGFITDQNMLKVRALPLGLGAYIYRDGAELPLNNGAIELKPGNNLLGIWVVVNDLYVDFKYINVIYSSLAIDPPSLDGEPNTQYTFTAKADAPPTGARYEWYVDDSMLQSDTSTTFTSVFPSEGNYTVSVTLVDSAGNEVQTAEAAVAIKASTEGVSAGVGISAGIVGVFILDDWGPSTHTIDESNWTFSVPAFESQINITWSGNSFSGTSVDQQTFEVWTEAVDAVSGTLSADGKTLLTLDYTYHFKGAIRDSSGTFKLVNIPFATQVGNVKTYTAKSDLQSYITKIEFHEITYSNGEKTAEWTVSAPPVKDMPGKWTLGTGINFYIIF